MARKNFEIAETPSTVADPRPRNVLIYSRVSTLAQSQNRLSSEDQIAQLIARSKRDGDNIVGIFRDEGETATNMKRSGFEEMIARATDGTRTVDAILVYSFSRAFRNQVEQELTVQTLRKHRVELISLAEPLANDDTGDMFRKFIGIVNEYQSKETSRATTRTMLANARLGYSNGGNIPFGYMSVDSDIIGNKQKKKLAIQPVEAEIVKLAFNLARNGDGASGPLGTKKVAMWLNERGYRTRKGSLFGTGTINELLTREAYTGSRRFTSPTLQHPWRRIRKTAGLADVRIHDLRHTFASGGLLVGEGLAMIGKLLGHTQVQTTARYAHLASDPVKQAATKISDRLALALSGTIDKPIVERAQHIEVEAEDSAAA
jgi:site-specific DNA recombinase